MRAADEAKFAALMTGIADYYDKVLSITAINLYWEGLKQYDYEAIEKALWTHTQNPDTGQFMPKIADVGKMLQGRTSDQAQVAWSKVDAGMRQIGTYSDVAFDDSIIHRIIADMGGWIALGAKKEDEWPFVAKEFENRYRGYKMRGEVPEYPRVLTGMANAHNAKEGFRLQPPMLIGDEVKARRVMAGGTAGTLIGMKQAGEVVPALQRIGRTA